MTLLLTSLLTIVTVYVITEHHRKLIESKIDSLQFDVISYHNRMIDEVDRLNDTLTILTSDNVEQF
jgi:hypothetical protein